MIYASLVNSLYKYLEDNKPAGFPTIYYPSSPNSGKPQPPTANHIMMNVLPAQTVPVGLNTIDSYTGIIQFSVRTKANGGQKTALQAADAILYLFRRNTAVPGVASTRDTGTWLEYFTGEFDDIAEGLRIDLQGSAAAGFEDGGWYNVPVSIEYRVFN